MYSWSTTVSSRITTEHWHYSNLLKMFSLPSELHLTCFMMFCIGYNLQFILRPSGCWMDLKCGIVQVSVCLHRFLGQLGFTMKPTLSRHHVPISPISPGDDLQDPKAFIEFLISANIRLARLEFLLELHEQGRSLPRRQEAEAMRTRNGDTALVEIHEYKKLHVNDVTGRWDQMRIDFHVWLKILSEIVMHRRVQLLRLA